MEWIDARKSALSVYSEATHGYLRDLLQEADNGDVKLDTADAIESVLGQGIITLREMILDQMIQSHASAMFDDSATKESRANSIRDLHATLRQFERGQAIAHQALPVSSRGI